MAINSGFNHGWHRALPTYPLIRITYGAPHASLLHCPAFFVARFSSRGPFGSSETASKEKTISSYEPSIHGTNPSKTASPCHDRTISSTGRAAEVSWRHAAITRSDVDAPSARDPASAVRIQKPLPCKPTPPPAPAFDARSDPPLPPPPPPARAFLPSHPLLTSASAPAWPHSAHDPRRPVSHVTAAPKRKLPTTTVHCTRRARPRRACAPVPVPAWSTRPAGASAKANRAIAPPVAPPAKKLFGW